MPVQISSFLVPRNGNTWYLLEDSYVKGGFQVVATAAVRNAINAANRKEGMIVYVQADKSMWQLGADLVTWSAFSFTSVYNPFFTLVQKTASKVWTILHGKNCNFFHAQVFDSTGSWILPDSVKIIDANTVQIGFTSPIAGHCTLAFDMLP